MNWRRGYQTATSPFFSRIWTRSGLIRGDPKFGQGLGYVAALQVKCLCVYGVRETFMSTGYMYHKYDRIHWRLNDDFDINRRRCQFTQNICIGVSWYAWVCLIDEAVTLVNCNSQFYRVLRLILVFHATHCEIHCCVITCEYSNHPWL